LSIKATNFAFCEDEQNYKFISSLEKLSKLYVN